MKYHLSAVVSTDENGGIGKDGSLLMTVSRDMKNFRTLTVGKTVILGSKTLATFPEGKPLKKRRNIVLSHNTSLKIDGADVYNSVEKILSSISGECFIIGGGSIYNQFLPYFDTVYMTKFRKIFDADTFFPALEEKDGWYVDEIRDSFYSEVGDSESGVLCDIVVYRRK